MVNSSLPPLAAWDCANAFARPDLHTRGTLSDTLTPQIWSVLFFSSSTRFNSFYTKRNARQRSARTHLLLCVCVCVRAIRSLQIRVLDALSYLSSSFQRALSTQWNKNATKGQKWKKSKSLFSISIEVLFQLRLQRPTDSHFSRSSPSPCCVWTLVFASGTCCGCYLCALTRAVWVPGGAKKGAARPSSTAAAALASAAFQPQRSWLELFQCAACANLCAWYPPPAAPLLGDEEA